MHIYSTILYNCSSKPIIAASSFELSPFGTNHDEIKYSKVTIENDVGWIFADLINYYAIEKTIYKPNYSFLNKESFSSEQGANTYSLDFMFTRKQLLFKRSYMKVQELAAAVGGIFKFVSQIFGFVAHLVGSWIVDNELVSIFFKLEERDQANIGENANKSDSNIVRNIKKKEVKIGFCRFYSNMMCRKKDKFSEARAIIASALDVKEIYKNHLKIEFLCHHLLNEETLKDLELALRKVYIEEKKPEQKVEEVQPSRLVVRRNE